MAYVIKDSFTDISKGFGYITFDFKESAENAHYYESINPHNGWITEKYSFKVKHSKKQKMNPELSNNFNVNDSYNKLIHGSYQHKEDFISDSTNIELLNNFHIAAKTNSNQSYNNNIPYQNRMNTNLYAKNQNDSNMKYYAYQNEMYSNNQNTYNPEINNSKNYTTIPSDLPDRDIFSTGDFGDFEA